MQTDCCVVTTENEVCVKLVVLAKTLGSVCALAYSLGRLAAMFRKRKSSRWRGTIASTRGRVRSPERTAARLLSHREQKEPKQFLFIGPNFLKAKTSRSRHCDHFRRRIFVGELGDDLFAGRELKGGISNVHSLRDLTDQMHLNAPDLLIVNGSVRPLSQVKIRAELAIDPREQV